MKNSLFLLLILLLLSSCLLDDGQVFDEGNISAYFCPQDHCLETMLSEINGSQNVSCAFYDLDIPELIDLLEMKGADVLIDEDNVFSPFQKVDSPGLMHNKFCILDGKKVLTGSMNPTKRGNYYNDNNLLLVESTKIASAYMDEFNELSIGISASGDRIKQGFFNISGISVEIRFCPEDNCKLAVIRALQSANESIRFMTYSFTDEDIGNLLWNKDHLGIDVEGIFEKRQLGQYSRYGDLSEFSYIDKNTYTMHHKVFIIDRKIVITGSYNPTKNANERNDENILIIHDEELSEQFLQEYERVKRDGVLTSDSSVSIFGALINPSGKDQGNEYVVITNKGMDETVDLSYYFISDNKTRFRLSGKLFPGEQKQIFPSFSLRNKGGTLKLYDSDSLIDSISWENAEENQIYPLNEQENFK